MDISVIICTHNPRRDYLARVLNALREQTLDSGRWELIVIDNASLTPLADEWDLSWHPHARHVREERLGLASARIRGIQEAIGELIVFVDDDNVLAPNYLGSAIQIGTNWSRLGVWGGSIKPEFEVKPLGCTVPLLSSLAIRLTVRSIWSNNPEDWGAQPIGAGMCLRSSVANVYRSQVEVHPLRRQLGRAGESLASFEDTDLVATCCDLGLGFGRFPELELTHLIPRVRLQPSYLIRLTRGAKASEVLFRYLRSGTRPSKPGPIKTWLRFILIWIRQGEFPARVYLATQQGIRSGCDIVARVAKEEPDLHLHSHIV